MWEISGSKIPDVNSPYREDFLAQLAELGYANMTDEVAITIKTKENLILTMAGLPRQRRIALSYGKAEFIKMCSFNGQQCDIIEDFKLHVDSTFGNCYTFNANRAKPLVSSRAGPSYGLRLMAFVNASDYLPTTEAAGVRIAIHERDEFPFPDTFGYSAPTGFVSSFGLSLRKVNRLSVPYAECVPMDAPLPESYIFRDYKYETEGCTKSCYQQIIAHECGCSDPRFPTVNGSKFCDILKESQKNCLYRQGDRFSRDYRCKCTHPCVQEVYSTTYSAARWPSGSFQVGNCDKGAQECIAYYGQNAVMLEVYYEQMSFEVLTETEAYLMVNLISDCGGQLGLWMGFSVITMIEVIVLIFDLITLYCRRRAIVKSEKALQTLDDPSDAKTTQPNDRKRRSLPLIYADNKDNNYLQLPTNDFL
uniref:Amiloride-sensitive sodium channel n=1 Tax=Plectus sambesii TaxID=2011161 RepID=A0A914XKG2_9BILA